MNKSQTNLNEQKSKFQTAFAVCFEHWKIWIWSLFDIWDFDIGIYV